MGGKEEAEMRDESVSRFIEKFKELNARDQNLVLYFLCLFGSARHSVEQGREDIPMHE